MNLIRSTQKYNISLLDFLDDECWSLLGLTEKDSKAYKVRTVKTTNPKITLLETLLRSSKGWRIETVQVVLPFNENGTVGKVDLIGKGKQLSQASLEQVTTL